MLLIFVWDQVVDKKFELHDDSRNYYFFCEEERKIKGGKGLKVNLKYYFEKKNLNYQVPLHKFLFMKKKKTEKKNEIH